ncbi:MAG: transglutaminase family protein, partial [Flavobacteriaceae bacterium]|nr:transglutaminase family protein [Flavobacteriaceae bacterium]
MPLEYSITYSAENHYENLVKNAIWQFLIIPENSDNQSVKDIQFNNSLDSPVSYSENSKGFRTIRVTPAQPFKDITFTASFKLVKEQVNPFDFIPPQDPEKDYSTLESLEFRVNHDSYLRPTSYT